MSKITKAPTLKMPLRRIDDGNQYELPLWGKTYEIDSQHDVLFATVGLNSFDLLDEPTHVEPFTFDEDRLVKDPYQAMNWTLVTLMLEMESWSRVAVPMSGGKDSRSVLLSLLLLIKWGYLPHPGHLIIYFCDTLLEYPSFLVQAKEALDEGARVASEMGITNVSTFITRPKLEHDFMIMILGKGLIPPTPNMRWCTDRMKIQPPRDVMKKQGWNDATRLIGSRFKESERRDKILSCTVGGECGPDYAVFRDKNTPKVLPIARWRQCAVWDFLNLIATSEGFDITGLTYHYGPDGNLRYGCWSCPLVYNDPTGQYLAQHNPAYAELVEWTNSHFRRGGLAFNSSNREMFEKDGDVKDGRLSLAYCRSLYHWILSWEIKHGIKLLESWQTKAILAEWEYRSTLPSIMKNQGGQLRLGVPDEVYTIHSLKQPILASTVVGLEIEQRDTYHELLSYSAELVTRHHPERNWRYISQRTTLAKVYEEESDDWSWRSVPMAEWKTEDGSTPLLATVKLGDRVPRVEFFSLP